MAAIKSTRRPTRAQTLRAAGKLIRRLLLEARARLDDELRPQEVTAAQLRMLLEVRNRPGISGAQLARACEVTPQTTQAMLARAVEHGWLARGKDEENHRLVTFTLTSGGAKMLELGEATYAQIETKLWRGIKTEDVQILAAQLEKALANLASPGKS
jgi:DNA-binding MarR family transcriptional regulator